MNNQSNPVQSTDLELVRVGDEGRQVVVVARGREGAGHAADNHLLSGEDVASRHVLYDTVSAIVGAEGSEGVGGR